MTTGAVASLRVIVVAVTAPLEDTLVALTAAAVVVPVSVGEARVEVERVAPVMVGLLRVAPEIVGLTTVPVTTTPLEPELYLTEAVQALPLRHTSPLLGTTTGCVVLVSATVGAWSPLALCTTSPITS
jgi:hypothetical protein